MAKNNDINDAFDLEEWRLSQLTPEHAVDRILSAKVKLYNDYLKINELAKKGESITGGDFRSAENYYNDTISDIIKHLPKYYSAKSVISDSDQAFSAWYQGQNKLPSIDDTDVLNKIFARDYLANARPKNTLANPDTDTPQKLFSRLLSNNNGIAFAGIKDDSAEIELVIKNMELFRKNDVGAIYLIGHSEEIGQLKRLYPEELKRRFDDLSEKLEKTPSPHPLYAARKQEHLIASLLISARENGISVIDIGDKGEAGEFESSLSGNHRVASNNFALTDKVRGEQIISLFLNFDKYIVIGNQENFVSTSDKANGKVDEALGVAVISLKRSDNGQPLIEVGNSANGPDFYLKTHACRPDAKGLAAAGDYNDLAKAIGKNMDRMPNSEDIKAADHYASMLDKKAVQLRNDYYRSLEVCDVPEREAKTPPSTPAPLQLAANTAVIKK